MSGISTINPYRVPHYFGGRDISHYRFDRAVDALVALTGRTKDDPVVALILSVLREQMNEMLGRSCDYGRALAAHGEIVDKWGEGMDNWPDEVHLAVTGTKYVNS